MEIELRRTTRVFKTPIQIGSLLLHEKYFLEGKIDRADFELSVLPGLHQESFEQATAQLESLLDSKESLQDLDEDLYPSVRFAIESWQNSKNQKLPFPKNLDQNALLLIPDASKLPSLRLLGFSSFKIKIARGESANDLIHFCNHLLRHEKIRLDGNQKMTPSELKNLLDQLRPYWDKIDYIEEPFGSLEDTLEWDHPVKLAVDETLPYFLKHNLPKHLKRIVLKPALFGFNHSAMIINQMNTDGVVVTLSSCFEGPTGLAAISALAGLQNTHQPNPAGLDTLKFFKAT